jgi:hypothetical protein
MSRLLGGTFRRRRPGGCSYRSRTLAILVAQSGSLPAFQVLFTCQNMPASLRIVRADSVMSRMLVRSAGPLSRGLDAAEPGSGPAA